MFLRDRIVGCAHFNVSISVLDEDSVKQPHCQGERKWKYESSMINDDQVADMRNFVVSASCHDEAHDSLTLFVHFWV